MFIEGLVLLIQGNTTIKAALGVPRADGSSGLYPSMAPDEVLLPYIVFMQISRSTTMSYQGVNRLQRAKFRFSCYGASYKTAKVLAQDVRLLLDGYTGILSDSQNTPLFNTVPLGEMDSEEPVFKATVYGTHLDYEFTYFDLA